METSPHDVRPALSEVGVSRSHESPPLEHQDMAKETKGDRAGPISQAGVYRGQCAIEVDQERPSRPARPRPTLHIPPPSPSLAPHQNAREILTRSLYEIPV